MAVSGTSRMVLEGRGRDGGKRGAGVEKSSASCPEGSLGLDC